MKKLLFLLVLITGFYSNSQNISADKVKVKNPDTYETTDNIVGIKPNGRLSRSVFTFDDLVVPTGLEAVDEGNGIGWRLIGRDPEHYANIGFEAIDLSFSLNNSTTKGASGSYSFALGLDSEASGLNSVAISREAEATGSGSVSIGQFSEALGGGSVAIGAGAKVESSGSIAIGSGAHVESTATSSVSISVGNSGSNQSVDKNNALSIGRDNNPLGEYSMAIGRGLTPAAYGEVQVGTYSTNTTIANNTDAFNINDRAFVVGIGDPFLGSGPVGRRDGFEVYKNGLATLPNSTAALINTDSKAVITRDYLEASLPSAQEGYSESGSITGQDLVVDLGSNSSTILLDSDDDRINIGNNQTTNLLLTTNDTGQITFDTQDLYIRDFGSALAGGRISSTGLTSDRTYNLPNKTGTFAMLDDVETSSFKDVATGLPNTLTTTDIYREGKVGINEPNPEEQLDVIGSFKQQYTYPTGEVIRNTFGGTNVFSEDGFPSGSLKTWLLDFRADPTDFPGLRSYAFGGDINAVNATSGKLSMGAGIADLTNSQYARLNIFTHDFNSDRANEYIAALQVEHNDGNRATLLLENKGSSAGHNLEATIESVVTGTTVSSVFRQTPHSLKFSDLLQLEGYGQGTYSEGYTHTDNLTDTGTNATTVGPINYLAGFDPNGIVIEKNIEDFTFSKKVSISSTELINTSGYGGVLEIVPAPGVGKYIEVISATLEWSYNTTGIGIATDSFLYYEGGFTTFMECSATVASADSFRYFKPTTSQGSTNEIFPNASIRFTLNDAQSGGDGTAVVYITYKIIEL